MPVPAADAVDDGHRFRAGAAVAEDDLAVGRSGRVAQPLKLKAGKDIGQPAVAVVGDAAGVEEIKAGRKNDIADFDG